MGERGWGLRGGREPFFKKVPSPSPVFLPYNTLPVRHPSQRAQRIRRSFPRARAAGRQTYALLRRGMVEREQVTVRHNDPTLTRGFNKSHRSPQIRQFESAEKSRSPRLQRRAIQQLTGQHIPLRRLTALHGQYTIRRTVTDPHGRQFGYKRRSH